MKKLFPIFLVSIIFLFSCTKEGPMGPQGFPGNDGKDATGSKMYYFNMPISNFAKEKHYEDQTQFYNDAWVAYGYIENVTIQETDMVMVYMHQTTDGGPDNYFQALPYTDYFDNSTDFNHYSYGIKDNNGDLVFSIRRNDGTDPFNDMNATFNIEYNVYIIAGTKNKSAEIPSSVNINNEEDLKVYLGISKAKKAKFIVR